MQKLYEEFKNTPTDIPHVCSSVSGRLNREETLSVFRKVLTYNNSDAALTGFRGSSRAKPAGTCYKNHLNLLNITAKE